MAQFRVRHPYNPGFELPGNVMAEPPGRGTLTTDQLRRKTFYPGPRDWTGGYALPNYVKAEPQGRGVYNTFQARRKTIPMKLAEPLGAIPEMPKPGFPGDPIKAYGERASEYLLRTIRKVPVEFRGVALQSLLDEVEPGLYSRVTERANEYESKGMSARTAVKVAIASSMSEGMAKEIVKLGQGKVPAVRSQMGLAFYGDAATAVALDGLWSSIKSGVNKVGSAAKSAGSVAAWPAKKLGQGIKKGAGYVEKGAKKAWEWGKTAVNKLGSLACGVLNSPIVPAAAGVAATAYGAPPQVGAKGVEIGASMCAKSETPAAPQAELMEPQKSSWILPAAVGGAGLLAAFLVMR